MKYDGGDVPEGYKVWDVHPTLWGVFKCVGENGDCIGEMWNRIFNEFLPSSDYTMLDDIDIEFYKEDNNTDCFCEIWIPVEKK